MAFTATNLEQFNREMDNAAKKILPEQFVLFHKKVAMTLLAKIVMATPVGNPDLWKGKAPPGYVGGRARGNWQVAVGKTEADNENELEDDDKYGAQTIANGSREINFRTKFGSIITIYNNVPYITALEEGHSTQAPQGMVGRATDEVGEMFR